MHLGFLCGQGLGRNALAGRYLRASGPLVPGELWLITNGTVLARSSDAELPSAWPATQGLGVSRQGNLLATQVLPECELVVRLTVDAEQERAAEICLLLGRLLAVALLAEDGPPGLLVDDYRQAKRSFKRIWLEALLRRHQGNLSAAARSAGINRATIHDMVTELGVSGKNDTDEEAPT